MTGQTAGIPVELNKHSASNRRLSHPTHSCHSYRSLMLSPLPGDRIVGGFSWGQHEIEGEKKRSRAPIIKNAGVVLEMSKTKHKLIGVLGYNCIIINECD